MKMPPKKRYRKMRISEAKRSALLTKMEIEMAVVKTRQVAEASA
jgi:hypothetical protein